MTIATDDVYPELVDRPRRWDLRQLERFMLSFVLLSSVFDYLTFGALVFVLHAKAAELRTGWFVESVVSAVLVVLIIRTRRPALASRPSPLLAAASALVIAAALALPFTPLAGLLELVPVPGSFAALLGGILALYMLGTELMKPWFYRHAGPT